MSVNAAFAANLSRLCASRGSIQSVCRQTHINRQQFARYLTGNSIPRAQNLEKIASFFGIDQASLFARPPSPANVSAASDRASETEMLLRLLDPVGAGWPVAIAPGIYFAHFAYYSDVPSIIRSTLVIRREGEVTTFRRLTGISERKGSWWGRFTGDHRGIVLQRQFGIYFMAIDRASSMAPSMLVVNWITGADLVLGGHACILTPSGPTITAVVLKKAAEDIRLRQALRMSHAFEMDHPDIDPVVVDALSDQCRHLHAMVRPLDLSVKQVIAAHP